MKFRLLLGSLLLAVLVFGYFSPALSYHFSGYDDLIHISSNRLLQPLEARRIVYFWRYPFNDAPVPGVPDEGGRIGAPYKAIYSPLSFTVWSLLASAAHLPGEPGRVYTYEAAPLNPEVFHAFSIFLQAANAILLFLLLYRLTKNAVAAWLAALLFALHPVQLEPVVQCTGMNNLLAGFWALLAMHCYLGARRARYVAATALFALSLLAKPSAIPLLFVMLGMSWLWEKKSWRHYALTLGPWLLLAVASALVNRSLQSQSDSQLAAPLPLRPFVVGDALAWYLAKLVWPFPLAPDYGRKFSWVLAQSWGYATWLVPALVLAALWLWRQRAQALPTSGPARARKTEEVVGQDHTFRTRVLVMVGLFMVALLPTSGIIGYYFATYSTVADRYLYLPLVSLSSALALIFDRLSKSSRRTQLGLTPLLAVWFAVLLVGEADAMPMWGNDLLMWQRTYRVNPHSWLALESLSREAAVHKDYGTALDLARRAIREVPENWIVHLHYSSVLKESGDSAGAIQQLQTVLNLYPGSVTARMNYGFILMAQKNYHEASQQFAAGLEIQPYDPNLLGPLGVSLCRSGDIDQGTLYLKEAMRWGFNPGVGHTFVGIGLAQHGNFAAAKRELLLGLKLQPRLLEALYNLGLIYLREGDSKTAESYLRRTIESEPAFEPAYLNLAQILLARKDRNEARDLLQSALRIKPSYTAARSLLQTIKP